MPAILDLPMPHHYDSANVVNDSRWLDYNQLTADAIAWRDHFGLRPQVTDKRELGQRIGLLVIDNQNTFCHPQGELFVGGRSGTGAVDDSRRLVEFVYRNLGVISEIHSTLDTHRPYAVFHPLFVQDQNGAHPAPFTEVTHEEVLGGVWQASPYMASALGVSLMAANEQLKHYTAELEKAGRYKLTIWPFHGMMGDKGHALVSGLAEAIFFHAVARGAQPGFQVKGTNPWVENYSVLGPEVTQLFNGHGVPRNTHFLEQLLKFDVLIIAGQAKSHCVAWTIADLLDDIARRDPALARKVYLLEDCTSPVTVPDGNGGFYVDYTPQADEAFARFQDAGMHVVRSTDPIASWPGIRL